MKTCKEYCKLKPNSNQEAVLVGHNKQLCRPTDVERKRNTL